jgi:hypothetical protein
MTEKITHSHEHKHSTHEGDAKSKELHNKQLEALQENAEKARNHHESSIENTREKIKTHAEANKDKEQKFKHEEHHPNRHPEKTQKQLKDDAYQHTMQRVRSHLSKPEQTLSKLIHQPVVERVSDIAGKTIARPTGVLFSGILTFILTTGILIAIKHYGFAYNYLLFFIVFVLSYLIATSVELTMLRLRKQ